MHIEIDTSPWVGGAFGDSIATTPNRKAIPFTKDHLIGVLEAALKAHHQHAETPSLWDRVQRAFGRTPKIALKGQYIRAAFFFTGRPLHEPLKAFGDYTVSVADCAMLLKELRVRIEETARKAQATV